MRFAVFFSFFKLKRKKIVTFSFMQNSCLSSRGTENNFCHSTEMMKASEREEKLD